MMDLPQWLHSRVPPPDSAPPLSLALMYDHVAWDGLWVPPRTLLRVLFEWSYTINTCILHIFDIFHIVTIYSTCILNILWHTFVWWQARCISWWRPWCLMGSHLRCIPPLGWLLHKIFFIHFLFVTPPCSLFCSRHFYEYKLTNSNKNHEHREMMLCNDFSHWREGYCTLLCMIPSRQRGKSLHSIISRCSWFLFEFVSLYS